MGGDGGVSSWDLKAGYGRVSARGLLTGTPTALQCLEAWMSGQGLAEAQSTLCPSLYVMVGAMVGHTGPREQQAMMCAGLGSLCLALQ